MQPIQLVMGVLAGMASSLQVHNNEGRTLRLTQFKKRSRTPEEVAAVQTKAQEKRHCKNMKRRADYVKCMIGSNGCLPQSQSY